MEDSMFLALFAALMLLGGLIIRERGLRIVRENPRSLIATRNGLRCVRRLPRHPGSTLAILGAPWILIGFLNSSSI
jgi:hypothetical protein